MINVSIVTYKNKPDQINTAISSIISSDKINRVYVVDNSPTDELKKDLINYSFVVYIHNPTNPGYGSSHNVGINQSIRQEIKYHIVINPDIVAAPGSLDRLYEFMEQNQDVGLVMPKVLYENGSMQYLCKLLPTPFDLILRRFFPGKLKRIIKSRTDEYELKHKDYNSQMDVPSLSGCFMFLRTDVLKQAGGFDERFFMYLEDIDLTRRIGQLARTVYYPLAVISHGYAKESYKSPLLLQYHIKSAIAYFNKWGWLFDGERKRINAAFKK